MSESGNLAELLARRARDRGWDDRVAYVVGDRPYTHGAVHDAAARTGALLARAGVAPGDRVLLVADDGIEFVAAFLGTVRVGAVAVPVNPRLTDADHRHAMQDAGAAVVVCPSALAGRFGEAMILDVDTLLSQVAGLSPHPAALARADDPAYAQYTSGTTGPPKAAVHRHGDPIVYFRAFAEPVVNLHPDDVVLSVSKMFFAYGLGNSLFFPLFSGCRAVLHPGPAQDALPLIARHGVTVLFAVPTFYARMVGQCPPEETAGVRVAVSAGEILTAPLTERVRRHLGCPLLDSLGSTEVGQAFIANSLAASRDGTVGRPLAPYEVSVRDPEGLDLPAGDEGLLWVKGPTVLDEYLNPRAAAPLKRAGWLCTGDRAVIDADGFVQVRGRADDIERVGGMAVVPREIEELLCLHPAVAEVAVAGVRLADGSSRLEAFVVVAEEAGLREGVEGELLALVRSRLAAYKVPRVVNFVDALPRTPTGKLRRFVLREGLAASPP